MLFENLFIIAVYGTPLLLIWFFYAKNKRNMHVNSKVVLEENVQAGLIEPASIHPIIDTNLCRGCGSCVSACPERGKQVLGLIHRKAELINPTSCIGHGACKKVCPFDAITLVFGTSSRGVDIPNVSPAFESSVKGIFIAGELGGMGLIRNAVVQGVEAMQYIAKRDNGDKKNMLDVLIVGAGPAGFAAALQAMKAKQRVVTIEQETLGGTVAHFPRGKLVMTAPVNLPLIGKVKFTEVSKEKLLSFWQTVEKKTSVKINYQERVESVENLDQGFLVTTNKNTYKTNSILLAIGRRGTPRKLGVDGEELGKVMYRLIDPEQFRQQHVLVVGGGDSALEAALSISEEAGTNVTLSYRSATFSRAKVKNRDKIEQAVKEDRIKVLYTSNVKKITQKQVFIDYENELLEIDNDSVIVSAGGILPSAFLKSMGIEVETKYGTT